MPTPHRWTEAELNTLAERYEVEPRALKAVMAVETGGAGGFLADGRVRILFERHHLWKRLLTRGITPQPLSADRPDLCGRNWNPNPKRGGFAYGSSTHQWERIQAVLDWARQHAPEQWESYKKAAYESSSWGLFQLMGENYAECGLPDVYALAHALGESEARQIEVALAWMQHNGLLPFLRRHDWGAFALRYNGPGQVPFYRGRLEDEYRKAG